MGVFRTDEPLWYNNGIWGSLGYAVPNFGDDPTSVNAGILYLATSMGRNLSAIMHHPDADLKVPPSINTLTRIHKLVLRARMIIAGRAVAPGTPNMEPLHAAPAPQMFLIYPIPYFKVRSQHLKEYCGLVMSALSECYQHTENRKAFEISTDFGGLIGQYLNRMYVRMATELFGITAERAKEPTFALTDAELAAYDPGKWFTSTEMVDTVPKLDLFPTEDDLRVLVEGIPASQLVGLTRWPLGGDPLTSDTAPATSTTTTASGTAAAASAVPAFPAAPGP